MLRTSRGLKYQEILLRDEIRRKVQSQEKAEGNKIPVLLKVDAYIFCFMSWISREAGFPWVPQSC